MKSAKDEAVGDISVTTTREATAKSANTAGLTIVLILIAALATGAYFLFNKPAAKKAGDKASKPVTVALAKTETVPIEIRTTGNILPYSSVNIIPQVGGQLKKIYFTQGDNVKKGALLFLIDPTPYQAALDQAMGKVEEDRADIQEAIASLEKDQATVGQYKANLAKDLASLGYASIEEKRYKDLVQQGVVSKEQADQKVTNNATATAQIDADKKQIENQEAVVHSDRAQIVKAKATLVADQATAESVKIQRDWCTIRSPMDGCTGKLQIYEGNVVAANNAMPIINIAQVQPIFVQFTIPEEYLDQVRRCLSNGTLHIQALLEGAGTNYVKGSASFMDNTVNTTSGTALLRATFANTDLRLYPGQFVDVLVTMPPAGPSIVVPLAAIQTTQKGNAVYVVKPDHTVELNQVELQRSTEDYAALASGINAGDMVVTDGQLQLTPGQSVKIVTDKGSGGRHKQGSAKSPDASFSPDSADKGGGDKDVGDAGGNKDESVQSNAEYSPLPTGSGVHGKAWNANPGYGSQQAAPREASSGTKPSFPPSSEDSSAPFNPATNGGRTLRTSAPAASSTGANNADGAFAPLPGATHPGHSAVGGWRHRH